MKFTQQSPAGINFIRRYGADFVAIGDEEIRRSCLISATAIVRDWPPHGITDLGREHLEQIFELAPEVVVLSTGASQQFPRAALRAEFATRRIGLEVMEIGAACRTFNVLVGEERQVVGAILLP